jgi:hypothetical protein
MSAVISPCGDYRYLLTRTIRQPVKWYRPGLFIMLNPSTADAELDDPTIRRCISFAKREGCTELRVVNLFAFRSTDPDNLEVRIDPVGPDNIKWLQAELNMAHLAVAAWGNHKITRDPQFEFVNFVRQKPGLKCLGMNKNGSPKHPLYVKADTPLVPFEERV